MRIVHLVAIIVAVCAMGCEDTQSTDVATADIRLDSSVTTGNRIEVYLHRSTTDDLVELAGGDRLVATVDGAEIAVPYDGTIAAVYRVDVPDHISEVTLSLLRDSGDDAAISVVVPPDPAIDSPTSFSRADDEVVTTWSNPEPGANVTIFVDSCADIELETPETKAVVEDGGAYSLPMSEVLTQAGSAQIAHPFVC